MRVLLIQPPLSDFYHTSIRTYPLGIMYLAEAIKEDSHVCLLDLRTGFKPKETEDLFFKDLNNFYRKDIRSPFSLFSKYQYFGMDKNIIKKKIEDFKPHIVCISSLFSTYFEEALEIAKIVKSISKDIIVVSGGNHPTLFPEQVLLNKEIDFLIRGEGETPLRELIKTLKKGGNISNIEGLCLKNKDYHHISEINVEKQIDIIPARELIDPSGYKIGRRLYAFVISSRGCPKRCSFCGKPPYPFRKISLSTIEKDIDKCMSLGIGHLDFEDDMLTLDKPHFAGLLDVLKDKNLYITAMNGIYHETLTHPLLEKMLKAGFRRLNISLVDLSEEILSRQNRFLNNIDSLLKILDEMDFQTEIHFIIGLPGQEPAHVTNSIIFLMERRCLPAPSVFYLAPGSPIFESVKDNINFKAMRSSYMIEFNPLFDRKTTFTLLLISRFVNFLKFIIDKNSGIKYLSEIPYLLKDDEKLIFSLLFREKTFYAIKKDKNEIIKQPVNSELIRFFLDKARGSSIKGFKTKNIILFDL